MTELLEIYPQLQINEFWKRVRDFLKKPSDYQVACQTPKPVLLSTGEMFFPYAWAVFLIFFPDLFLLSKARVSKSKRFWSKLEKSSMLFGENDNIYMNGTVLIVVFALTFCPSMRYSSRNQR